jgi:arsenate reductase-like glutaredoxin family protein
MIKYGNRFAAAAKMKKKPKTDHYLSMFLNKFKWEQIFRTRLKKFSRLSHVKAHV